LKVRNLTFLPIFHLHQESALDYTTYALCQCITSHDGALYNLLFKLNVEMMKASSNQAEWLIEIFTGRHKLKQSIFFVTVRHFRTREAVVLSAFCIQIRTKTHEKEKL
jgi:hypothetical protein